MPIQVMPDRKWIHRSRNRKPDSFISAIEPSLERTAVQAVPSLVIFVVEILVVLLVVVQVVVLVVVELVVVEVIVVFVVVILVDVILIVIIEVIQLVVEVVVLVVLVHFVGVALREQRDVLVLVPRPSATPRHQEILRIIPPQNSATGVLLMVVVGRDYSKAFFVSTRFSGRRRRSARVLTMAGPVMPGWEALDGPVALPDNPPADEHPRERPEWHS